MPRLVLWIGVARYGQRLGSGLEKSTLKLVEELGAYGVSALRILVIFYYAPYEVFEGVLDGLWLAESRVIDSKVAVLMGVGQTLQMSLIIPQYIAGIR